MTSTPRDELMASREETFQFVRQPREGGFVFVTSPLFPGWSYMLSPRENDNSLFQSISYFSAVERYYDSPQSTSTPKSAPQLNEQIQQAAEEWEATQPPHESDETKKYLPCPICGGEAIHALDILKRTIIRPAVASAPRAPSEEALAQIMCGEDRLATHCATPKWENLSDGRKESYLRHARAVRALLNGGDYMPEAAPRALAALSSPPPSNRADREGIRTVLEQAKAFIVIDNLCPVVHEFERKTRDEYRKTLLAAIDAALSSDLTKATDLSWKGETFTAAERGGS